ncbi:MAG: SpoIVB peptidase [Oscillospiraceae bacterium]|nr:SpoIVB peptidase [Oscillospiraceae bacterium]
MRKIIKSITGVFFCVSFLLCVIVGFYYVRLPDKYYLSEYNSFKINAFFDITAEPEQHENSDSKPVYAVMSNSPEQVQLKLMGVIPIKSARAERIERPMLIPCGTPFGIKIITGGAIVTECGEVDGINGFASPAKDGGIRAGDVITKVNGRDILRNNDIAEAVQLDPQKTIITYIRGEKTREIQITPVKSNKDGLYKIGLWVRDSSAGIGTMTYYNPADGTFGGLGHAVCDVDTGQILPLSKGEAVSVFISNVVKGYSGNPGELCGTFLSRIPIGIINGNTEAGIFGIMEAPPVIGEAIEMAYKQEVEIGQAIMLATIDGNAPKEYDIIIEKIDYNEKNKVKNMVIKVTDRELLNQAGGIVQGMSGSPIIQNGRLVGAVTHVFVSDPSRGYAIFAENMYRASLEVEIENNNYMLELEAA